MNLIRTHAKIQTYFSIVETIANLSTSSKMKVGAIAIKIGFENGQMFFGYNGNYPNAPIRSTGTEEESLEPGKSGFIHAEENLLISFRESDPQNYLVLLSHSPCRMCSKKLVRGGFKYVYWKKAYREIAHLGEILGNSNVLHGNMAQLMTDYSLIIKSRNP